MEHMMANTVISWSNGSTDPNSPYSDIASAIVAQAAKDFIMLQRKLWKKSTGILAKRMLFLEKMELEDFFHSPWYEMLTDMDPDRLLSMCRDAAIEQEKKQRYRQRKRAKAQQKKHQEGSPKCNKAEHYPRC